MDEKKQKIEDYVKKGWINAWLAFEAQAVSEDALKNALEELIKKMKALTDIVFVDEIYSDISKSDPMPQLKARGVKKTYSQVAEVVLLVKDFELLVNLMINFGPSAVEVLAPEKITLDMRDAQNTLNSVAELMHKYAAAGVGGVMIAGGK